MKLSMLQVLRTHKNKVKDYVKYVDLAVKEGWMTEEEAAKIVEDEDWDKVIKMMGKGDGV